MVNEGRQVDSGIAEHADQGLDGANLGGTWRLTVSGGYTQTDNDPVPEVFTV